MSWGASSSDARVLRTHHRVVDAFAQLLREASFEELEVSELVRRAQVARSTFYAHYRGKDEVLRKTLGHFHAWLAEEFERALEGRPQERLHFLLEHFLENAELVRRTTSGAARHAYERSLDDLGERLAPLCERHAQRVGGRLLLPPALLGAGLARASMGLILDWVRARPEARCPSAELAAGVRRMVCAWVGAQLSAPTA